MKKEDITVFCVAEKHWWIKFGDKLSGPFSSEEEAKFIRASTLGRDTYINMVASMQNRFDKSLQEERANLQFEFKAKKEKLEKIENDLKLKELATAGEYQKKYEKAVNELIIKHESLFNSVRDFINMYSLNHKRWRLPNYALKVMQGLVNGYMKAVDKKL